MRWCIRGGDHHRSRGRDLRRPRSRFPHRRRSLYAGQHERLRLSTVRRRTARCWRLQRWLHYPVRHLPELHASTRTPTLATSADRRVEVDVCPVKTDVPDVGEMVRWIDGSWIV